MLIQMTPIIFERLNVESYDSIKAMPMVPDDTDKSVYSYNNRKSNI